jgi:hypothetical protein
MIQFFLQQASEGGVFIDFSFSGQQNSADCPQQHMPTGFASVIPVCSLHLPHRLMEQATPTLDVVPSWTTTLSMIESRVLCRADAVVTAQNHLPG